MLILLNKSIHPRPYGGKKQFILAPARLGFGWARTGLGSARLGSSWPGLVSALPVSAWLRLARPRLAWLCPGWLGLGSGLAVPSLSPHFGDLFFLTGH